MSLTVKENGSTTLKSVNHLSFLRVSPLSQDTSEDGTVND